jgi:hypothetical protein
MHEINMLLHSILDIIFKLKEWPWWILQDDIQFDPLRKLLEIRKWGILQKDKVGKWEKPKKNYIYCQEKPKVKPSDK